MSSVIVNATKAAITIACGGVGYAVSQACAPGSDGKGGFAAGVAVGNALQGVVSNYGKDVGDWLSGKVSTLAAGSDGPATNHDLDELAAQAIAKCLRIAAQHGKGTESVGPFAAALAEAGASQLRDLLREPAFAETDDAAMLMLIGQPDGGIGTPAQTSGYWESYARALAHTLEVSTGNSAAVTFVAGWVYRELAAQANEILRDTFGPKGRPYVAVQMLFAQQTLTAVITGNRVTHSSLEGVELKLADFMKLLEGIVPGVQAAVRPPPSTVPTPSPTFIPRKNITAKIHAALTKNPQQVVIRQAVTRAMGGYGKTVAAILYAHEYKNEYPGGRFFLSVESANLVTALAGLAAPLGLTATNNPGADAEKVKGVLESGEPSLLILDNVASKAAWEVMMALGLIPRGGCRVLVTTRDEGIDPADAIKVDRLSNAEAREVFRLFCYDRREREEDEKKRVALPPALPPDAVADEITAWLGGLAVSIAAVAAYMKLKPHIAWEAYWGGDGKNLRGLRNTPVVDLPEVKPEVAAQLGIGGRALEDHRKTLRVIDDAYDAPRPPGQAADSPEQRAIQYAALLPHDLAPAVWLEWLLEADAGHDDGPQKITLTPDPDETLSPAQIVLRHLDTLDVLLPGGEGGKLLSLHRLWHARVNERAEAKKVDRSALWGAIGLCAQSRRAVIVGTDVEGRDRGVDNPAALTDQGLRWELTPLAALCAALWTQGDAPGQDQATGAAAGIGVWLAGVLGLLGRFSEAAACLVPVQRHEVSVEQALGAGQVASCYSNLAMIQRDQGDLPGARASMERAIAIDQKHFAPDHPTFATSCSNLALIQQAQGDLPGARASMERAIAINEKHFAPDHPTLATSYSNLATIQQDQGDLPGARASMERAIAIAEKHLGAEHPNLATMRSNLAAIQKGQGDLPGARESMERAIAIAEKHLGAEHPNLATMRSNLATIQQDQGDLPGARASMERAIAIDQKHFAPDHPTFATRYSNLATIEYNQGDLPGARVSMERAIAIEEKHFAPDHPTFATSYSNLATIQQDQGDLPGARASMERAIAINQKHFAPDHPTFATRYNNLASIYFAEGKRAAACANFTKALAILRKHFGEEHPNIKTLRASMKAVGCPQ